MNYPKDNKACLAANQGDSCWASATNQWQPVSKKMSTCAGAMATFFRSRCSSACKGTEVDPMKPSCKGCYDDACKKKLGVTKNQVCPGSTNCADKYSECVKPYVCDTKNKVDQTGYTCVDPKTMKKPTQFAETQQSLKDYCGTPCAREVDKALTAGVTMEKANAATCAPAPTPAPAPSPSSSNTRRRRSSNGPQTVTEMQGMFGTLCSKNAKGLYCHVLHKDFQKLPPMPKPTGSSFASGSMSGTQTSKGCMLTKDQQTALKNMGCCTGTIMATTALQSSTSQSSQGDPVMMAKQCGITLDTKPCGGSSVAIVTIESTVTMKGITAAQFGDSEKAAFTKGIAQTAGVKQSQVTILSVKDATRRASGVTVTSQITLAGASSSDLSKLADAVNTKLKDTAAIQKNIQASSTGTSLSGATTSSSSAKTTAKVAPAASSSSSSSANVGMIVGVVIAAVVVVGVAIGAGVWCRGKKKDQGVVVQMPQTGKV
jgi:hypothetical protein